MDEDRSQVIRKEMDTYISSRKKTSLKDLFSFSKDDLENIDIHPDVEVYGEPKESSGPTFFDSIRRMFASKPAPEESIEEFDEQGNISPKEVTVEPVQEPNPHDFDEYDEEELQAENEPREGVLSRIMTYIFGAKVTNEDEFVDVEEASAKQAPSCKQDMKQIARFTAELIAKLPPEEVQKLKESSEFKEFKDILNRNQLIKKEE